jgi:hypothetical protein
MTQDRLGRLAECLGHRHPNVPLRVAKERKQQVEGCSSALSDLPHDFSLSRDASVEIAGWRDQFSGLRMPPWS